MRVVRQASVLSVVVVVLAGCSGERGGQQTPPAVDTSPATTEPAVPEPGEPAAPSSAGDTVTEPPGETVAGSPVPATPTPDIPSEPPSPTAGDNPPPTAPAPAESAEPEPPAAASPEEAAESPGAEGRIEVAATKAGLERIGAEKCKMCHKVQYASWSEGSHAALAPPVDCESCHGPGSEYWPMAVMKDSEKSKAAGVVMPTAAFCTESCHEGDWSDDMLSLAHTHKAR
jgi:hypothetical protein